MKIEVRDVRIRAAQSLLVLAGPAFRPRALDERRITGTFFVVGEIAEAEPGLVRDIAAAGHELALHGWRHVVLTEQTPDELADDVRRGKALLEDLAQHEVVGFRAPTFSLVASTVWATDVLLDAGYRTIDPNDFEFVFIEVELKP